MRNVLAVFAFFVVSALTAFALAFAVSGVAVAELGPSRPKVRGVEAAFTLAPDSTVNAQLTTTVTGTLQPGDSIRFKVYKDNVSVFNKQSLEPTMLATGMPAPAYGATANYKPCVVLTRNSVNQGSELCGAVWTYTRPAPAVPVLTPPVISPASAILAPGQTFQFTVLVS